MCVVRLRVRLIGVASELACMVQVATWFFCVLGVDGFWVGLGMSFVGIVVVSGLVEGLQP